MQNRYRQMLQTQEYVLLDGAMGTMLQQGGLIPGKAAETMSFSHPQLVTSIHQDYIRAGSHVLYANTFSCNRHKLEDEPFSVEEAICQSLSLAKTASAGSHAIVALDVGPIGELLEPSGTLSFTDAYELFRQQVVAAQQAGAELIAFETFSDLYEVKAAVLAAKEHTDLPIQVTMSFEENGRTFTGCSPKAMAVLLTGLGVDAIGVNCSLGPRQLLPILQEIGSVTHLPLVIKANAGLPDAATGAYSLTPEQFAEDMALCAAYGAQILGGCCGTDPQYIRALADKLRSISRGRRTVTPLSRVCSPSLVVELDGRIVPIGERINPTGKKRFQQALLERDMDYVLSLALSQVEAGAQILDINVGHPGVDEPAMMEQAVKAIQSVTDVPLQIDSSNPAALEAGLRAVCGKAIVNSVNGESAVLDRILPLVKKYGAAVVGLTLDDKGIPRSVDARLDIARRILERALSLGIPKEDVYIDCLTLTVSAQQDSAAQTLNALNRIRRELGLQTVLGVSNISFGLPNRELMNTTFLTMAMQSGLTLPILNPDSRPMMSAIAAYHALRGFDRDCLSYVESFAHAPVSGTVSGGSSAPCAGNDFGGSADRKPSAGASSAALLDLDLPGAVARGLSTDAQRLTAEMLQTRPVLEIVEQVLIPALDVVGQRYETGEIFLPQLMKSAEASKAAFDVLREHIAKTGGESVTRGKIVLATVQGDIHDIGKNIVKAILANYGYQIIDLGRDVAPEKVVEAALRENVPLVGLSALMTTTLAGMERTITALRDSGHSCKVVVGGAVLTPEYASRIGADFYAKDARAAVDVAAQVFS